MPERKDVATYENVMRDLRVRKFSPVYLLMGEEGYFIDKISSYIEDNVLLPDERFFNQVVVFGSEVTAAQVHDLAKAYPMPPAQRRVVIVKEFQNMRALDALEKYLDNPALSTILVLCYKNGTIDRRKKIVGRTEALGVVFESKKKRESELPSFIESYLRDNNAVIDNNAAVMISEHVGSDLNRIVSELDKILLSLSSDERRVTSDIVEKQIGISKDYNQYELRQAVINCDALKANRIVNYFEKNPKAGSLYSFLPMLFSFFQNMMIAYYTPNARNERALTEALGLKSVWAVKDYIIGMKNYTAAKTLKILYKIRETDAKSKGLDNPNTDMGDLMKELIFYVLH